MRSPDRCGPCVRNRAVPRYAVPRNSPMMLPTSGAPEYYVREDRMKLSRRQILPLGVGAAILHGFSASVRAENYPSRAVRILVATSAGGSTDIVARLIAQWLTEKLGQSFFVE